MAVMCMCIPSYALFQVHTQLDTVSSGKMQNQWRWKYDLLFHVAASETNEAHCKNKLVKMTNFIGCN